MTLRALDLFCGAGGVSKGLQRAGFRVTGTDIKPQKNYCGDDFVRGDVTVCRDTTLLKRFDFIWASPPCQAYSQAAQAQRAAGKVYPDLVAQVREMLDAAGVPYTIENVPKAPIRPDVKLCGCYFGLKLRRERWFETSWREGPHAFEHKHDGPVVSVVSVVGHGTPSWVRQQLGYNPTIADYRAAMGIDWMNRTELSQAIPPAYAEYIARQFLASR